MKYLLIDNFENTKKIVNEKELRNLYNLLMEEIIFDWKDCKDKTIIENLQKEKEQVYTCNIKQVINAITDIDNFYEIKEV